jgi:two-component sensor histidine kinase
VTLRRTGDNEATIIIRDNGIGLPRGVEVEHTSSLGLQLVKVLVDQVHGRYFIERNGGTVWTITIPITNPHS